MNTNAESFTNNRTATRAGLGGMPGINTHDLCTSLFRFVPKEGKQLTPGDVVYALGEVATRQAEDAQVLDPYQGELDYETASELVIEVPPLVGNPFVSLGHLSGGIAVPGRAFLSARHTALLHTQIPLSLTVETGGFDTLTRREGGNCRHAQVDAHRLAGMLDWNGVRQFKLKTDEPAFAVSVPGNDCGLDLRLGGDRAMQENADVADVLNPKTTVLGPAYTVTESVLNRPPAAAGFEPGIARRLTPLDAAKESGKGFVQAAEGLLHRREVEQHQPVVVGSDVLDLHRLVVVVDGHPTRPPEVAAFVEGIVVEPAVHFDDALQGLCLFLVRLNSVPITAYHELSIAQTFYDVKSTPQQEESQGYVVERQFPSPINGGVPLAQNLWPTFEPERKNPMSKRNLKTSSQGDPYLGTEQPHIRFGGKWLREAGFQPGDSPWGTSPGCRDGGLARYELTVHADGVLTITKASEQKGGDS